jgi:hypothetical protein
MTTTIITIFDCPFWLENIAISSSTLSDGTVLGIDSKKGRIPIFFHNALVSLAVWLKCFLNLSRGNTLLCSTFSSIGISQNVRSVISQEAFV